MNKWHFWIGAGFDGRALCRGESNVESYALTTSWRNVNCKKCLKKQRELEAGR